MSALQTWTRDPSPNVRRSVANNLNDIAKDHPRVVEKIARRWLKGAGKDRRKLVRHACRTLIKQGRQGTLKTLGYGPPRVEMEKLRLLTPQAIFGEALIFELRRKNF